MSKLQVQAEKCSTCIFKPESPLDLGALLDDIRDPRMRGHFSGYRVCHHSDNAVCAGFWALHKDHFDLGQIAQRLGMVELVTHDKFPDFLSKMG